MRKQTPSAQTGKRLLTSTINSPLTESVTKQLQMIPCSHDTSAYSKQVVYCSFSNILDEFIHFSAPETYCKRLKPEPAPVPALVHPLLLIKRSSNGVSWSDIDLVWEATLAPLVILILRLFVPRHVVLIQHYRLCSLDFMVCLYKSCCMSWPIENDIEIGSETSFISWPVRIASGTLSPIAEKSVMSVNMSSRGQAACPCCTVFTQHCILDSLRDSFSFLSIIPWR